MRKYGLKDLPWQSGSGTQATPQSTTSKSVSQPKHTSVSTKKEIGRKGVAEIQQELINIFNTLNTSKLFTNAIEIDDGVEAYEEGIDPIIEKYMQSLTDKYIPHDIINSLTLIGKQDSVSKEYKPDGVWGQKTTVGLENVSKIMNGILSFADASNVQLDVYTKQDLNELNDLIKDHSNIDKIIENLKKINQAIPLYGKSIYETLLAHKGMIQDGHKMAGHEKITLDEKDKNVLKANSVLPFDITGFKLPQDLLSNDFGSIGISVSDIIDQNAFKSFLSQNSVKIGNKPAAENIPEALSYVISKLQAFNPNEQVDPGY